MMRWFGNLLRQTGASLRLLLALTVVFGIAYPAAVWGVSRLPGLQSNAEGSVITDSNGQAVGSSHIGIDLVDPNAKDDPTKDRYFHTRPAGIQPDTSTMAPFPSANPSDDVGNQG